MKGRELRGEARIPVREKGSLSAGSASTGDAWFPCVVQDMSDSGFLIICSKELAVGQVLEFRCQLFPEKTLNCKIEVRHLSPAGTGTKIKDVDGRGTSLIQLYLQEQYSLKLSKS